MRAERAQASLGAAAVLALAALPAAADEAIPVDLELVLAIDTSGSVDPWEFNLQIEGLAAAFRDAEVQAAIAGSTPGGLAVTVVQWSGPGEQMAPAGWALLSDAASADDFARRIEASGRQFMGRTGISDALRAARALLAGNGFEGRRKVVDISGDGEPNDGHDPASARDAAVAAGITINGLAVMTDVERLDHYYRERIIGGPGAFVVTALDYGDFVRAIRQKLLREIRGTPIGAAPADGRIG